MNQITNWQRKKLFLAVAVALTVVGIGNSPQASAQQESGQQIEEIVVSGQLRNAAREIMNERIDQPFAAEVIGIDQISAAGDSDMGSALRRVTGLSLVDSKFVYVRGLGERYSSATINQAEIPSPELSRNVIPLDLIPASILDSVKVSKAYSADQPAAFGGGNINIRTRGVPSGPVFSVQLGSGWNTENSEDGLNTLGDQGGLPAPIAQALNTYQGDVSPGNIVRFESPGTGSPTLEQQQEAVSINRDLALSLNRDIGIEQRRSIKPDYSGSVAAGNTWDIGPDLAVGVLASLGQSRQTVNSDQFERSFTNPEQEFRTLKRSFQTDNTMAAFNFSASYMDRHTIRTNSYLLQNDEDQANLSQGFNPDFQEDNGVQRRINVARLEKRELLLNQLIGEHSFEDGDYGLNLLPNFVQAVNLSWFYSDAQASTELPNASSVQGSNTLDTTTGELLRTQVDTGTSVQFSFLDLEDTVETSGYTVEVPFLTDRLMGSVSGGYTQSRKGREYLGYTANLISGPLANRTGLPTEVLQDSRLSDLSNDIQLDVRNNFGTESYVAGEKKMSSFGAFDVTLDQTWRVSGGLRWEDFKRGVLPLDLLDYSGASIAALGNSLQNPEQTLGFQDDGFYPAAAFTYIGDGFLNTENFQLRLGYGRTVVRPDLREFADVQFIDPTLNNRVQGNPNLVIAEIDHFDLRSEFFFPFGDSITASLFYKDIANPIEQVERPGPQDARLLSFENAESGQIYGLELEGLKLLPWGLFVSGNVVLSDSELSFSAASSQTNQNRRLSGHSKYVVNTQLGFDSDDGRHAASLLYNVFGDRIFFGGREPTPDAFEKPFHSLDLVYTYYPFDGVSAKLRVKNLLNSTQRFEQNDITIIEVQRGTRVQFDLQWQL
ncbi:MAG: TonB-dependent receptor [Pseudohongiellaceae bacterium]